LNGTNEYIIMMIPHTTLAISFLMACFETAGNGRLVVDAFAVVRSGLIGTNRRFAAAAAGTTRRTADTSSSSSSSRLDAAATNSRTITLSLPKPLGLILEEVEEGQASGVFVASVAEVGSAVAHASDIVGSRLVSVQGQVVTALDFDAVMDTIINAPATVELVFDAGIDSKDSSSAPGAAAPEQLAIGTTVKIVVLNSSNDGSSSSLEINNAKVGDNLRQTLLDNGFEVYQGLKQKLGNCGGAGQCTFCAMEFIESQGWGERSDYEDGKLKRNPKARLACLNNIQGPATIQKAQR
jgi:ferredoxin